MTNHVRQPGAPDPIWSVLAGSVVLYEGTDDKKAVTLLLKVARNPLFEPVPLFLLRNGWLQTSLLPLRRPVEVDEWRYAQ